MMDLKAILEPALLFALERLSEPSTWTASGGLVVAIHTIFPGALGDGVTATLSGLCFTVGVVAKEKGWTK